LEKIKTVNSVFVKKEKLNMVKRKTTVFYFNKKNLKNITKNKNKK